MLSQQIVAMLRCPETRQALRPADAGVISRVNAAIAAGRLTNRSKQPLEMPLNGGLVREDGTVLYPILDDIPILLIDESIALDALD